jgi:hypothetical protein
MIMPRKNIRQTFDDLIKQGELCINNDGYVKTKKAGNRYENLFMELVKRNYMDFVLINSNWEYLLKNGER